jgi:hypothetical protein
MNLIHSKSRNRPAPAKIEQQVFIHINRRILDHPIRKIFQLSEEELLRFEALTEGLQKKELYLHKGDLSDSNSDSDSDSDSKSTTSSTSDSENKSDDDKVMSLKRRNSAEHTSRPYFQPHFNSQATTTFAQYSSQGQNWQAPLHSGYKQAQVPLQRVEVPNRPHSTHIDKHYFRPVQVQSVPNRLDQLGGSEELRRREQSRDIGPN